MSVNGKNVGEFFECLLDKENYCEKLANKLQDLNIKVDDIDIGDKLRQHINGAHNTKNSNKEDIKSNIDQFLVSISSKTKKLEEEKSKLSTPDEYESNKDKINEINKKLNTISNIVSDVLKFRKSFNTNFGQDLIKNEILDLDITTFMSSCFSEFTSMPRTSENKDKIKNLSLIIENYFNLTSSREEKINLLNLLNENKKFLDNSIILNNFKNNIDKFISDKDNTNYLTAVSDILQGNAKTAQAIITSKEFNEKTNFKYNLKQSIFFENAINSAFEKEFNNETGKRLEENDVLRFSSIKRYFELKEKKDKNDKEKEIFNNIKNFLDIEEGKENEKLLKLYTNWENDINKTIDLIHLGIIKNNETNISLDKIVSEIINRGFNDSFIESQYFNDNTAKFIEDSFNELNVEKQGEVLDILFSAGYNSSVPSIILDTEAFGQNKLFDLKSELVKKYNNNEETNSDKAKLYENVIAIENTNYTGKRDEIEDNIKEIKDIIARTRKTEKNAYNRLAVNINNAFKTVSQLEKGIKPETKNKSQVFKGLIEKGKIEVNKFENTILELDLEESVKSDLNALLCDYIKNSSEIVGKNDITIEFKDKTVGGSAGFYANITDKDGNLIKRIFVKKENTLKQNPEEVSRLFSRDVCTKIYSKNDSNNKDDGIYILTEGVGESDLSNEKFKDTEFFNEKDEKYIENFANSFTKIFAEGYLLNVQDIRKDNIRVDEHGNNTLVDWVHNNGYIDKFKRDPSYMLNNSETNFTKNIFNNLLFQSQLFGQTNIQPKNDGTQQLFNNLLNKLGSEKFEEILLNQISQSFFNITKNYDELEVKNDSAKLIFEDSSKKFNELYNVICTYHPDVRQKLDKEIYNNLVKNPNYIQYLDTNLHTTIFNEIIKSISDNSIKNEIENFKEKGNKSLDEKAKCELQKRLEQFPKDIKLSFWNDLYKNYNKNCAFEAIIGNKKIKTRRISMLFKKTKDEQIKSLLEETKRLKKENKNINDINNVTEFSEKFLGNTNENGNVTIDDSKNKDSNLTINFPEGNYKQYFSEGFTTSVLNTTKNGQDEYSITFGKLENEINFSLIEFIQGMRLEGILPTCEKYGIDVEIKNKDGISCKNDKIFRKNETKDNILNAFKIENKTNEISNEKKTASNMFKSLKNIVNRVTTDGQIKHGIEGVLRNNEKEIEKLSR